MDSIKLKTPMQLWEKFDPRQGKLEVSILSRKIIDSVEETLYSFTPIVAEDGRVRITVSIKRLVGKSKLPVVLYVPSYNESSPCGSLSQLVNKGLAVATLNYNGESGIVVPKPRYPKSLSYGYYGKSQGRMSEANCSADQTSVHLWSKVVRRAITLIESIPLLDADRICGMAWGDGASILWQIAGVDNRLKLIVPILNSGYGEYAGYHKYSANPEPEFTDERTRWIIGLAVQSYAKSVACEVYIVSASNDKIYAFDRCSDIMALLSERCEHRQLSACGLDGQIYSDSVISIVEYITERMVHCRDMAKEPIIEMSLIAGKVNVGIDVDNQYDNAESLELFYCSGEDHGEYRSWNIINLGVDMQGKANSPIKIYDNSSRIYAYATVKYKSGVSLSSRLITMLPSELGEITTNIKGTRIIYERKMGINSFFPRSSKHIVASASVIPVIGPLEIMGVSSVDKTLVNYNIGTVKCDDEESLLQIDIFSATQTIVRLSLIDGAGKEFFSEIMLKGESEWTRIQLNSTEFKDSCMVALKGWAQVKMLKIYGANELIINNILWV